MREERLPRRVMFGEMVGGKRYSFGQEKDWMERLEEDQREFSIKSDGWRDTAQTASRWFRWAEDGTVAYMRKWRDAQKSNAEKRHVTVAW